MAIIFDGKSYALKKAEVLKKEVLDLNINGIFLPDFFLMEAITS